jgi:hypothetical protein
MQTSLTRSTSASSPDSMPTRGAHSTGASVSDSVPAGSNAVQRPTTRLQHGISKKKIYKDGTIDYGKCGLLTHTSEPTILDEALENTNWKNVIDDKFAALQKNKT